MSLVVLLIVSIALFPVLGLAADEAESPAAQPQTTTTSPQSTTADAAAAQKEKAAKEKGLIRIEGKDYVIKDGDIVVFRFNV